jgi:hypothetical protein
LKRILVCAGLTLLGTAVTAASQAIPASSYLDYDDTVNAAAGIKCPKCHHENSAGAHFCSDCGAVLHADGCPHCGASIGPADKFCSQCGYDLTKGKETEAKDQTGKTSDSKDAKDGKDQAATPEPPAAAEPEQTGGSLTKMRILGFMDTGFYSTNNRVATTLIPKNTTSSFRLGEFDLYMSSILSDKMNVLAETTISPDPVVNSYGIEVERLLLNYRVNDKLNLSFGRYHTHVGYYSTAYHHGTVLQTAATRPFLFEFEDNGGPLPIHNIGIEADGPIPSGKQGLRWVFEAGNGRASTSLGDNPTQNYNSDKNDKAFNLALIGHPDYLPGLEYGASAYHDRLVPTGKPSIDEWIFTGHVVYQNPNFEWLNEAVLIHHTPGGMHTVDTPGFYSQIAKQFGLWRPYARYEYINSPLTEPFRPDIGLRYGPRLGVKYDLSAYANIKFEFDHTVTDTSLTHKPVDEWFATVGFTF